MEQLGGISLYALLGVQPEASQAQITRAYRQMALKVHPDKNPNDPDAHRNFQTLTRAYSVLNNPLKRNMYDLTGDLEQSEAFLQAYNYYRDVYTRLTVESINEFAATYKGSEMEKEDLMEYYIQFKGDMTKILEYVPLSQESDLPRFWKIFDGLIKKRELPRKKAYNATKRRVKPLTDNGEKIGIEKQKMAITDDLVNAIRNKPRGNFLQELEAKYTKPKKKRK